MILRNTETKADAYVDVLHRARVEISMTQSGSPYDNAIAERINGILKVEFDLYRVFESYSAAVDPVCKAISAYNTLRLHYSCDLNTPQLTHSRESRALSQVFSDLQG